MLTLRQATFKEAGESKEADVRLMYFGVETNVLPAAKSFHCTTAPAGILSSREFTNWDLSSYFKESVLRRE